MTSSLLNLSRKKLAGNHIYLGKWHDFNQWKYIAPSKLINIIKPVHKTKGVYANTNESEDLLDFLNNSYHGKVITVDELNINKSKTSELRGSAFHGPERTDVFRLTLFNRLKQKHPQRIVPSIENLKDANKLEVSIIWFLWSFVTLYCTMCIYGSNYMIKHKSSAFPWMPKRTDGSKGEGPMFWFLE
ncbi:cytochrome c oxidase subunit ApiCOX19, putative [Hepatocystis sp. ex Piliocolobus tephrosceles]|nr:cytochrome c oxidase subunit ApiCOX19, putative [Hepatocystis sp. ex Piliocolobus tephrosceles]